MKRIFLPLIIMSILTTSCRRSPAEIEYGSDMCHFCKMTIVDQQHAAEVMTIKGRTYKFDAIECMIPYLLKNRESSFSHILVNNYNKPKELLNASGGTYIITKSIPSPMGGFLSAVENQQSAANLLANKDGEIYSWSQIKAKYQQEL